MAGQCFLGIDFGTSGARACVIASNGEIEEMARLDFGRLAEQDLARGWRNALLQLIAGLPQGLRKRLGAMAIDGTSGTVLACDSDVNPLHPPLLYNDARAVAESEAIRGVAADHPAGTPTSALAKILWLRPRIASARRHVYLSQSDWLTALLSGLPGVSEYHNALKMGFDVVHKVWPRWIDTLLEPCTLPEVIPPGTAIARLRPALASDLGIPTDCLVRSGTTDSIAAFLAAGVSRPGDAVTSLGTTLVLKLVSEHRVEDVRSGVYSHWYGHLCLAGGASNAGGGVLQQYFAAAELQSLSARIDPARDSGLDYYPLPGPGERFPINDPALPPRLEPRPADPVHFLHGLLDGLARIEAMGYARLAELGATPLHRVLSSGGGAGNAVYTGLRQRRLGVPVLPAARQEAAYGAARLAWRGTCLFPRVCRA